MVDEWNGHQSVVWRPGSDVPRGPGRHADTSRSHLPVSVLTFATATGVLLVATAYAAGRHHHADSAWADYAYWLGQVLIVMPTATRLLSRKVLTAAEIAVLITVLTVAEYLVTVCYSPIAFTFSDELSHWRSAVNILQTGKLFTVNYQLPISPHYPGLEEATSALASITGLSVFVSGLIIAGVAHLLFVYVLYVLFREISHSYRAGGVAVLCYVGNPHFASFDSMFIYQTLALPFFGLTLISAWHLGSRQATGRRTGWLALGALLSVATVVTHHVTSYMLVTALVIISLTGLLTGNRLTAAWAGFLALLSAVAVVVWVRFAALDTWGYLEPFARDSMQGLLAPVAGGKTSAPSTSGGPVGDRALSAAAVLTISALLPVGWWRIHRQYRHQSWPVAMAIASVGWYMVVAVRLTVADGSELAGRAATFVYVPVAYIVALAIGHLVSSVRRHLADAAWHWPELTVAGTVLMVIPILVFDGLANGWPPYWERLPGPHQVAGSERSVDPEGIAAAQWALALLGPGNRFAADYGNVPLIGTYGDQNPALNDSFLYTSPVFTRSDIAQVNAQDIRYVLVDQRLSQSLPVSGQYFPIDPNVGRYTHPLPLADLTKFDHVPGVARIYDSGNIVIYDLDGGSNAP